jgi:hypothetical protein
MYVESYHRWLLVFEILEHPSPTMFCQSIRNSATILITYWKE